MKNYWKTGICLSVMLGITSNAFADDISELNYQAQILLEDICPGDIAPESNNEFLGAVTTAFLTAAVKKGLSWTGQKLKESSEEKIVESVHKGDYFYGIRAVRDKNGNFIRANNLMKYNCMIIVTPPKTKKSNNLYKSVDWPGYFGVVRDKTTNNILTDKPVRLSVQSNTSGTILKEKLHSIGYNEEHLPSSVLVLDIESSIQGKYFRFVPRYFAYPHSPRDKRTDSKKRDFAYEIKLTTPTAEAPFVQAMIPMKRKKSSEPFARTLKPQDMNKPNGNQVMDKNAPLLASQWFPFPTKDADVKEKFGALKNSSKLKVQTELASVTSLQFLKNSAAGMGGRYPSLISVTSNGDTACVFSAANSKDKIKNELVLDLKNLSKDIARKFSGREGHKVVLDDITAYIGACEKIEALKKSIKTYEALPTGAEQYDSVAFDVNVTLKEFRKKPLTKFLSSILTDETFQGAIATETLSQIDPSTRKANAKVSSSALITAKVALDTAITAANIAEQAYLNASDPTTQSGLLLTAEQAKRAANRAAQNIEGAALPFPTSGFYVQE